MIEAPSVEVVPVKLDPDQRRDFEAEYGVRFIAPEDQVREDFSRTIERLASHSLDPHGLLRSLSIVPTKKAVLYVPEPMLFIEEALSEEQVIRINENETVKVARQSVATQREIERVPIEETFGRMVHLPGLFNQYKVPVSFSQVPFHAACGEWAGKERQFWVREAVAQRLLGFADLLRSVDIELFIEDAFRPVGVQEGLFRRRVEWTKRDHPEWSVEQVLLEAESKTAVKPRLASHKAGAAVDATMNNAATGESLDIGHHYPDGGALVFPKTPFLTYEQWRNRQLFQVAAGLADLTLYVGEDWHVSYGDNLASLDESGRVRPDYTAFFGPLKAFDQQTGEITEVYSQEEMNRTFDL